MSELRHSGPEQIRKAVEWYYANKERISEALPIRWKAALYPANWLEVFERRHLADYNEGRLSLPLARAYVYGPIKKIAEYLKYQEQGNGLN